MKSRKNRILFTIVSGIMLLAGGAGAFAQERPEVNGDLRTLSGRIRWNKSMGVLPKMPRGLEPASNICAQFFVVVTQPSTRSEKPIQYDIALEDKPEASKPDYYSCAFEMKVPSNVRLVVQAGMGDGLAWPKTEKTLFHYVHPWIASGRPTRVRSSRSFTPAKREVVLGKIGMYVTFELVYDQVL
jgi:hypothetical protein